MGDVGARLRFHKSVLVRGVAFTLATATVCGALALGSVLRNPSRAPTSAPGAARSDGKDQSRVGLHEARESGQTAAFGSGDASGESNAAAPRASVETASGEWRDGEFTRVEVVDGRTFKAGAVTITLEGLELPHPEQVCRTLDDRLEQCVARAATQLELLTRSRAVACRYRMTTSSEAVGSCRIGQHDLAARMARTGYVQRAADDRQRMAAAARS